MMMALPGPRPALLAAVLVTLAAVLFYREHRGRDGEARRLERRLERLEAGNQDARGLVPGGTAQLARRLRRHADDIARLEQLIPRNDEVPALLESLAAEARRSGLGDLALMRPGDGEANPFYTKRSYEVSVVGGYHEVARFLTAVASLPRIVTPTRLEMTSVAVRTMSEGPAVRADFRIETFVRPTTGTAPAPAGSNGTAAEGVR